jgi:hypothetical protein
MDKRIDPLLVSQARTDALQRKNEILLAQIAQRLERLENIAITPGIRLHGVEAALTTLEAKRGKSR